MTHVVTSNCVDCKFTDCVPVCPVDCFYETEVQLVIDPETCIDCSACVAECPVEAIYSDYEVPEDEANEVEFNAEESERLKESGAEPITESQDPLSSAEAKQEQLGY